MAGRGLGRDGVVGIVLLALCATLFAETYRLPRSPFLPLGPEFYPRIILGALAILSAVLVVSDLKAARPRIDPTEPRTGPPSSPVLFTFVLFALYAGAMPWFGFRVSTALFVTALAWLLGPHTAKGLVVAVIAGVLTAVLTAEVFENYLRVLLPRGRLL